MVASAGVNPSRGRVAPKAPGGPVTGRNRRKRVLHCVSNRGARQINDWNTWNEERPLLLDRDEHTGDDRMLTKIKFAVAAALVVGAVSAASAANDNQSQNRGGADFGPLGQCFAPRIVTGEETSKATAPGKARTASPTPPTPDIVTTATRVASELASDTI